MGITSSKSVNCCLHTETKNNGAKAVGFFARVILKEAAFAKKIGDLQGLSKKSLEDGMRRLVLLFLLPAIEPFFYGFLGPKFWGK